MSATTTFYDQFTDLSAPDANPKYFIGPTFKSITLTHLMKLVFCIDKFPNAIGTIKEILAENPDEINKHNNEGWTTLTIACYANYFYGLPLSTLEMLIDVGADLEMRDKFGLSALMVCCASSYNHDSIEWAKTLIKNGADVNARSYLSETILMHKCHFYCEENKKIIKFLIKSGANVDLQSSTGDTALMIMINNLFVAQGTTHAKDLADMIMHSKLSLTLKNAGNMTAYDLYMSKGLTILDDHMLKILKGEIMHGHTKSARNI